MPHSQGLFNNTFPEPNQPNSSYLLLLGTFSYCSPIYVRLGLSKGLFAVSLLVKILKALLPSSVLAT